MARRSAKRRLQVRLSGDLYEVAEQVAESDERSSAWPSPRRPGAALTSY
jgi:hypothetical protein